MFIDGVSQRALVVFEQLDLVAVRVAIVNDSTHLAEVCAVARVRDLVACLWRALPVEPRLEACCRPLRVRRANC